jgi:polyisoprenoid-binding protein YceI
MVFRKLVLALAAGLLLGQNARAADVYKVDSVHSTAIFRIKHMNTSFSYGRFDAIGGDFAFDQNPAQCRFNVEIKSASLDTGNAARDKHVKGPDFLNVVQYPTLGFKSRSVTRSGTDEYEVTGDLTIHGVTRPVTVKVLKTGEGKGPRGGAIAGFETKFTIKRSEFKMDKMVGAVGDEVGILVSVEGGR